MTFEMFVVSAMHAAHVHACHLSSSRHPPVQLNDRLEHGILSAVVAPVGAYK